MYKKILIPMALDHGLGPKALAVAKALRDESGEIIALHVYETPEGSVSTFLDEDVVRAGYEAARKRLEERVADHEGVCAVLKKGHTARTVVDFAADEEVDCIIMGSHKPGLRDYLLGSTSARVVRHAACSVHVLRD